MNAETKVASVSPDMRQRIDNASRYWLSRKTDEYLDLARHRNLTDDERAVFNAMCDKLDEIDGEA